MSHFLVPSLTAIACTLLVAKDSIKEQSNESKILSNTRQLTFAGKDLVKAITVLMAPR